MLCEKPLAADGRARPCRWPRPAEVTGQLLMVQPVAPLLPPRSPRFSAQAGRSSATIGAARPREFFKAPHFGGFREEMAHPLLVDMAIHAFDAARYLLGADPVSVYCEAFNPAWSWYAGDAAADRGLRVRRRRALHLHRQLVRRRAGDLVERQLADQRCRRHRGWDGAGAPVAEHVAGAVEDDGGLPDSEAPEEIAGVAGRVRRGACGPVRFPRAKSTRTCSAWPWSRPR